MKRALSLTLALVMILSFLSGLRLPAEAASASYNKGKRDEVCTSLSSAAKSYYTGSYTYDQLSSLSGSSLRTKLRSLITSNRSTVGYTGLKTYFPHTDAYEGSSSKLRLFYSDGTTTSTWDSGKTWNREHMWPDSKGGNAIEGDLHAMRPTDPNTNSTRGNNPYGYVSGGKTVYTNDANGNIPGGTYGNSTFEPLNFSKGDCARTILYDYVVTSSMSSVTIVFESEATLLEWCALDPVDTYEMSRNDVAEEIQGCRNPFVDYPELAWLLLGKAIPSDLTSPSGGQAISYSINAYSNNTSYGTVSLSGKTITATPATGCFVEGYTLMKGTATVTRDGNTFTVAPSSDCTVRINFAKKTTVTVNFNGAAASVTTYAGEAITLPKGPAEDGYTFVGWAEQRISPTADRPAYYSGGSSFTPTASVTLYPLYTYSEGTGGTGWTLLLSDKELSAGAQIILASNAKDRVAGNISSSYLSEVAVTFSQTDYLEAVSEDAMIFTLGGGAGAWTLTNEEGQLLGVTSVKNLSWGSGTTTWEISITDGTATVYSTEASCGRILHNVSAKRFTTYTSNATSSMLLPQIYMNGGGVIYYTTELTACDHSSTTYTKAVEATCTTAGNIAYYTCTSCGKYFADAACTQALSSSQLVIEAKGHASATQYTYDENYHWKVCTVCGETVTEKAEHAWDEGTVTAQPTETTNGTMTYGCKICSATYGESIPALGAKLYITFSVPEGVQTIASVSGYKGDTVSLPEEAGVPEVGYTFVGWTLTEVKGQTTPGDYYDGGQELTLEESITLKALYRYAVEDENGPAQWNLVTDVTQLTDGARVVIASNEKGKVAGNLSSEYFVSDTAVFSDDLSTITNLPETATILTLGTENGSRTLANIDGKLLGATAIKKLAWDKGITTWNITVEDGKATIYNTDTDFGRFLYNVSSPRFNTYLSAVTTSMRLPQLYILSGGSTIYYTTEYGSQTKPETPTEPTVDTAVTIGHTLNLASDISINYAVPATLLAEYDSYLLECVLPTYEGNTLTGSRIVTVEPVPNGNYYYFTLTGITAVNMNDVITATLYLTKGEEKYVSNPDTYSVAKYAYSQLEKPGMPEVLKILCANLLRYGSAAQTFKGYRTDALVDEAMTDAQKAYLEDLDAVIFGNNNKDLADLASPVVTWAGKSLLLDSKVTIRYIFDLGNYTGKVEDLSLRVTYVNCKGEETTATVTGNAQKYSTTEGRYSMDFDGLLAAELRTVVHAKIYAGETCLSNTLEYSVDTYGNNKAGALGILCQALMAYSDSAKAYFS